MTATNLFGLPAIEFASKDPEDIKSEVISAYELASQKATGEKITLYPGDPRRLFLLAITDMIIIQRHLIDWTAKQNMLTYASSDHLDHLGVLLGVRRLPSQQAVTTVKFTLSAPMGGTTLIPAGTRVVPASGNDYFATVSPLEIPARDAAGEVKALAVEPGANANGFLPGQINYLVDTLPYVQSVSNITLSSGGTDTEDDESLRMRIQLAPESFSVAGPVGAYEFWAKSANPGLMCDVAVIGPPDIPPGEVEIYPLLQGGELPTQDILDLVYATCNADDIRPLTDHVSVLSPVPVPYALSVSYWINRTHATGALAIQLAVNKAISDWALWQRSKIGRDITPSKLVEMVMLSGAKRVEILSPANRVLGRSELAVMEPPPTVIYGGLEDD